MKIAGIQKNSFVDYPGCIAAVFFTPGCNLNCFYCYNRQLIDGDACRELLDPDEALEFLARRKGFLDAVVISGGEPTLQAGLADFLQEIKSMGYSVKLDTNGTNPRVLERLIDEGLVDYVAMDLKAPEDRYAEVCGKRVDTASIEESKGVLLEERIPYEFRTTVIPQFTLDDIVRIAEGIRGARLYVLQQFKRELTSGKTTDIRNFQRPHNTGFFEACVNEVSGIVRRCTVRGLLHDIDTKNGSLPLDFV